MNREHWLRIKHVAAGALEVPATEREAFIETQCAGDPSLVSDVRSLLASAADAAQLFEQPCIATAGALAAFTDAGLAPPSMVGGRIGAYEVLAEIGRGGMGAAYLAARADDVYDKRVAIKLIKRGMDTDAILQRFHRERQILANLEHPNIVMLLDGGTTDDGRPYYVMEYVDGVPIDEYCAGQALSIPARLALMQKVCTAVHYAHEKRVLHRDLKPGNILVTANGVPKLLDFGIARLFDATSTAQTREPTLLAHAMTPRYASPEQVRGELHTPASDVYALGVLLYELVTGRSPYTLEGRSHREVERLVCDEIPLPPGARLSDSQRRELSAGRDRYALRDLDTIAMTALAKDPAERYATAQALGDDIARWLARESIASRPRRRRAAGFRRILPVAAAILLVAIAVSARFWWPADSVAVTPSLAVLPFADAGSDADLEHLADGLSEDILYRLARVPGIRVIARDSAYQYKGITVDPVRVGRELDVRYVLTGRFVRRGDTVTVSAELVDTSDRRQLWGKRYERPAVDMLALESELADEIAASLELTISPDARAAMTAAYTTDPVAYESYLKGRFFWNKRTPAAFMNSVTYFRQAIDRDPAFALAWVGLADTYSLLTEYHVLAAAETYPLVREALSKALALDPEMPEALISLAYLHQHYEWDFEAADRVFRQALDLNPNYATGRQWYAEFLSARGRHDAAIAEIGRALAVDPLSLIINTVDAKIRYLAGDYERALERLADVIALDPNFPEAYEYLKRNYDQLGRFGEAIGARQARRRLLGLDAGISPALAAAAGATDKSLYWQKRLEQEIDEARTEGIAPFEFAEIYAQAGHPAMASEWLESACRGNDFLMLIAEVSPNLTPLRKDEAFRNLIAGGCAVTGVPASAGVVPEAVRR